MALELSITPIQSQSRRPGPTAGSTVWVEAHGKLQKDIERSLSDWRGRQNRPLAGKGKEAPNWRVYKLASKNAANQSFPEEIAVFIKAVRSFVPLMPGDADEAVYNASEVEAVLTEMQSMIEGFEKDSGNGKMFHQHSVAARQVAKEQYASRENSKSKCGGNVVLRSIYNEDTDKFEANPEMKKYSIK